MNKKNKNNLPAIPEMTDFVAVLEKNTANSLNYEKYGKNLIRLVETEGFDDCLADEVKGYLSQCSSQIRLMHENRRPFTDCLAELQRRFVAVENAIDPRKSGTPATILSAYLSGYLSEQLAKARKAHELAEKAYIRAQHRIERRNDWDETEKSEALRKADKRRMEKERNLAMSPVDTEWIPKPVDSEGYMILFLYWWENKGCNLTENELDKIFHPAIMFAKAQAQKGCRVDSPHVVYRETPVIKYALRS